uniref:Uncharacterized protein n=2 Tax=Avena sativa TaxID=4498 RepID=A0ACD5V685_AVESA
MNLTVKTLKGTRFEIRVQRNDTIMAVKKKIEEVQGKDSYPWGQQMLIHRGKVLKDESTLDENQISEEEFLVVMLSKSKASVSSGTSSAQPSSTSVTTQVPPVAVPQAPQLLVPPTTTSQPERPSAETPSSIGIPVTAEVAVPVVGEGANPTDAAPSGETGLSGLPNTAPLDLFPQGASNAGGAGGGGSLDFLRNNQQFQALREMVHTNPQILQPMIQELGKQNPQLLRLIQDNNEEFLQLLEGGDGDFLDQPDQDEMPHAISVTPEEQEAIGRLEAMGFDRARVIEAFFACDRNEQLAVNYLLEHAGDEN